MRDGGSQESPEGGAAATPLSPQWQSPSAALSQFVPAAGSRPTADSGMEEAVRYGFRIAGIGLLLGKATGAELVSKAHVSPVPNAPAWLQGLMNLRGNLIPVIDLAAAMGLPAAGESGSLVLVFGKGERAAGVPIHAAPEAIKGLSAVAQLPPLPERLLAHAGEGHMHGQAFWVEFRHESFFESLAADGVSA